ncbi:SusC/RagA family TonB-linked outer membrane protein [Echinicola pacifica]|uniref:SusC/RagA family TonB-linked outer membrane protein n=1 Tax=Echinicola pacifica TaxID=346377 RepID=A0A918PJP9_9BACT|nr:TonB-dependent receptor [Echinicola pacifica]GGZ13162.1 SusC/RagA family TonB-linked outer membrane protein [Echinicola pacifica]
MKKQILDKGMGKLHYKKLSRLSWGVALGFSMVTLSPQPSYSAVIPDIISEAQAAEVTVTGVILDEFGEPMIGVAILQKDTSKGAVTDIDGRFTLEVSDNAVLIIRFIGYKTQEIDLSLSGQSDLTITMEPDVANLEEVVVVGFGEQTKQTLVGAVGTVKGEDLQRVGSVNTISEALQGAMPGLTAVSSGGKPGSDAAELFIRGRSSWNGDSQQPFTLVDGVERDINNLDPNEIESISVLKDASATAVYGVRGANGVILITTKRGRAGKPTFNFTSNFGVKQPTASASKADYLTAMEMFNEAATNDKNWDQLIPQSTMDAWRENWDQRGPYNPYFPEVDWYDQLLGTGYEQTYNLNARGGTEFVKYFVSLGYRNDGDVYQTEEQEEYDPAFGMKKYNWRSNFDFELTKSTTFSVNFSGNYRTRTQPGYRIDGGGEDGFGQAQFFNKLFQSPANLFPLTYADGTYGDSPSGAHNVYMQINQGGQRTYNYYQGFYDAELKQDLDFVTKGLKARGSVSYTSYSNYERQILRGGVGGSDSGFDRIRYYRAYDYSNPIEGPNGEISYPINTEVRFPGPNDQEGPVTSNLPTLYGTNGYNRRLNYRFQMDYKRKFGDHTLSGTALMWRQQDVSRSGYPSKREEWVGRANYYYKDRYLLEFNSTYSGSEKFAPGLRFGFFPSFATGWVASEEPWIKEATGSWLDFFKVNYSYGVVGSDGGPRFQYAQTYSSGGNIRLGYDNVSFYGPLYREGTPANPNSTWETSTMQNLSFKLDMLERLNVSLDFFMENREGILMERRTQPAWYGTSDVATGNIGSTKNRGYELEIGWNDKIGADFSYYVNFNTAYAENRIVYRDDPRLLSDYLKQAGKPIGWVSRLVAGGNYQSLDDIYNGPTPTHGVAQGSLVPGDLMFVDYNGDGITDTNDQVAMKNVQYPWRTYGLNFGFTYKNFGMNALVYGVSDVGYNYPGLLYWDFESGFIQAQPDVTNRWTPGTAATATKPALHLSNGHNNSGSTLLYEDGSYVRLKNIEVNYRFNPAYLKRLGLKSFQVYANGNNLLTWSQLSDARIDPETSGTGTYPVVKRYNLGLRVSF